MPRQARLVVPGIALHVIQRGNNRAPCFREDSDYLVYLLHLRELAAKLGCALHAYCLMTNHVHLLFTPRTQEACIHLMRDLGQRYVQYFNRRYERTGTLWEGRYRSCVAESASYVLACYRYIELNPVRAGMVQHPAHYAWSSYATNTGRRAETFLTPHVEFQALANDTAGRHAAYDSLFSGGMESSIVSAIREATNAGYPLASASFKSGIAASGRRVSRGRPGPKPTEDLNSGSDPELFVADFSSGGGAF